MICQTKDTFDTVDLCEEPDCIGARIDRDDLERLHLPTHDLVKVRRVVFIPTFGKMDRDARDALQRARALFKPATRGQAQGSKEDPQTDAEDDERVEAAAQNPQLLVPPSDSKRFSTQTLGSSNKSAVPTLSCRVCHKAVTQPCWYCVQCEGTPQNLGYSGAMSDSIRIDDLFICMECDAKDPENHGNHLISHDLVRCQEAVEDSETSLQDRLNSLENSFTKHEMIMDQKLVKLESTIDDRLSRLEALLEKLFERTRNAVGVAH